MAARHRSAWRRIDVYKRQTVERALAKMDKLNTLGERVMFVFGNTAEMLQFCQGYKLDAINPVSYTHLCASCSTSVAPRAALGAARPWCVAACMLRRILFRALSSTARCWPRVA